MLNTKHGVYANGQITMIAPGRWDVRQLTFAKTLDALCQIAVEYKLTHLWIMDDAMVPNNAFFEASQAEWDLMPNWESYGADEEPTQDDDTALLMSVTGCKRPKGGQQWFSICWPAQTNWQWCQNIDNGKSLLQIVKYLEEYLDIPIGAGVSTVGGRLLKNLNVKHPERLIKPIYDLRDVPFRESARNMIWQAPRADMLALLEGKQYLHQYDKNSQYLRACVNVQVGVGDPINIVGDVLSMIDNAVLKCPGIWKCIINPSHTYDDEIASHLPPLLWHTETEEDGAVWLATPILNILMSNGGDIDIVEAWFWPNHAPTLQKWGKKLWEARNALKDDKRPLTNEAAQGIKDIYVGGIGIMSASGYRLSETWKYRPDWHAQIVGDSYAVMYHNLWKYAQQGHYPVLVYVDATYYASNDPDPEIAVGDITKNKGGLGGYKHGWTLPIDERVREILLDELLPLTRKLGALNALAGE